jgi:hypothetical protein
MPAQSPKAILLQRGRLLTSNSDLSTINRQAYGGGQDLPTVPEIRKSFVNATKGALLR